jgi:hypothetical protein
MKLSKIKIWKKLSALTDIECHKTGLDNNINFDKLLELQLHHLNVMINTNSWNAEEIFG